MKTRVFAITATVVVFLASGCGGQRHATLKDKDGMVITHDDLNISLLEPSIGPIELAEAYRIKKQADMLDKMMTGLQEGKTIAASSGKFLIGIINNDRSRAVYVYHPEIPGLKLTAEPRGGFQILQVRDIPYEIAFYNMRGGLIKKISPRYEPDYQEKLAHKKLVGNILVDFLIKINKIDRDYGGDY